MGKGIKTSYLKFFYNVFQIKKYIELYILASPIKETFNVIKPKPAGAVVTVQQSNKERHQQIKSGIIHS